MEVTSSFLGLVVRAVYDPVIGCLRSLRHEMQDILRDLEKNPTSQVRYSFLGRCTQDPLTFVHLLLTVVIAWWALTLDFTAAMSPFLLQIMSGSLWHLALTTGAIIGFAGIVAPHYQRMSTQILSFLHALIALAIVAYKPFAPWAAPYVSLAVFSGYLCWMRRN